MPLRIFVFELLERSLKSCEYGIERSTSPKPVENKVFGRGAVPYQSTIFERMIKKSNYSVTRKTGVEILEGHTFTMMTENSL